MFIIQGANELLDWARVSLRVFKHLNAATSHWLLEHQVKLRCFVFAGLTTEGLYRVSGNKTDQDNIQKQFDQGQFVFQMLFVCV